MDQPSMSLAETRSAMVAAREALAGFWQVVHQASGAELAELMTLADEVSAGAGAARVQVTVEAITRGEVAGAGVNVHTWVRDHASSLRQGGAGQVAKVATAVTKGGPTWNPEGVGPDPESPVGIIWDGVREGSVSPGLACATLSEIDRLVPLLVPEAVPTVTRALLVLGVAWGGPVMRRLRPRLLAEHGHQGVLDDVQSTLAGAARLSSPVVESGDLTQYQVWMTPEQAATLEAAIGPLSVPSPNDETGEPDLRPAGQRRVEALTAVCSASSALDAQGKGADGAGASAAAVHVTVALTDLQAMTGSGEVIGSTATGTVLSPEVLRRVSCEADLIPHVLGSAGEALDQGRVVRLFTRAQRRRLWLRDRGCTYPGCTAPAAWARAHHVWHWADGGPSDIDNAALLCQRHHSLVHQRRLFASVRAKPDDQGRYVIWDLVPASYDHHLADLHAQRSASDPPPLTSTRLTELLKIVAGRVSDEHHDDHAGTLERQWAQWQLGEHHDTAASVDADLHDQIWTPDLIDELEHAS